MSAAMMSIKNSKSLMLLNPRSHVGVSRVVLWYWIDVDVGTLTELACGWRSIETYGEIDIGCINSTDIQHTLDE